MKVPRVSVFIASYNAPRYIAPACRSILDQSYRDLELVVVDDGSNAETRAILRALAATDPRLRLIEASHQGQIATLNQAVSLCRGEFIARLDHDDIAYPDRIARQVAFLDSHPGVVAVGSLTGKIDSEGRRKTISGQRTFNARSEPFRFPPRIVFLMGPTLMARATALRGTGGFRPQVRAAEDRDISWRLAQQGPTANIEELLIDHRDHDASLGLRERKTQAYASLISDLSAIAGHFGRDDRRALERVDAGRSYEAALAEYETLLADVYPVRSLVLLNLAKPRFLELADAGPPGPLAGAIARHFARQPLDPSRWVVLARLPRVLRKALAAKKA